MAAWDIKIGNASDITQITGQMCLSIANSIFAQRNESEKKSLPALLTSST